MKKMFTALFCAGMLLGLTACGSGTKTTEAAETLAKTAAEKTVDGELKEINLVLDWYPNAVHAFIYDAIDKGYYEDEGLKINIEFPSNANDAMSLTAAGKAEVGIYYLQDMILANANQDVPVKCFGTVTQAPLNIILSLKEKNINTPADLVGKTIGYSGNELSEATVKSMMAGAGVDPEDVTMIDVGFDLMSAMTTGQVDATIGCMVNHEVPQMEKEGFEVSYFYPQEYGVPDNYELIFITSDDMIENDSETLAAFMRASEKGFEDMKNDPEGTLDILLENQNAENFPLDKDVETKSMEILMPVMVDAEGRFGTQEASVWQENIDWMKAQGILKNDVTPEDLMTDVLNK